MGETRVAGEEKVRTAELPGGDLILAGCDDLAGGTESVAALLVSIGAPRLRRLGYDVQHPFPDPEHRLYERLSRSGVASAHRRYNALVRRLVRFERSAESLSRHRALTD